MNDRSYRSAEAPQGPPFFASTSPLLSWACTAIAAAALIALVGKLLDIRLLASGITSSIPMAPSTAYGFIFLAAALHPNLPWSRSRRARIGLLLPVFIIPLPAIAGLMASYLKGGWDPIVGAGPFDPWMHVWVMSPLTACLFFVVGASVAAGLAREERGGPLLAAWGMTLAAAFAAVVLIGYVYRVPLFYGGRIIPMAATTAGCFLIFSAASLTDVGRGFRPWSLFQGDSPKARMMRSFLPLFAGFMILTGFLDSRLSVLNSPLVAASILLMSLPLMAWMAAKVSASLGEGIETAQAASRESETRYKTLFDSNQDAVFILEQPSWKFTGCNASSVNIMRAANAEALIGLGPRELSAERQPGGAPSEGAIREKIEAALKIGHSFFEWDCRRLSGEEFPATILLSRMELGGKIFLQATLRDITERKKAEVELERLRTAIEQVSESVIITDLDGTILYVNPAVEKTTGYSREEVLGKNPRIFQSGKHDKVFYREMWGAISSGRTWRGRMINKRKDGTFATKECVISPVRDAEGKIVNFVALNRDISENIRLEDALRQSQKIESVGRLAGGVAHDFNNILTAIKGYTQFALLGLAEGDQRRVDLKEVLAAGERAARLTSQLLAFSRKQILRPEILDINAAVGGIVNMLKRLIGEDIKLETRLAAQPCLAKVDAGQIEQVFLNLAVNARDAMPKGGTLTFETGIVTAAEDFSLRHPDMPRGSLVCLSVRDTGCGMTEEVKTHLFEPFFTTKEKGKGTGLGLSTVYGIIKQSGGDIEAESAPDRGTIFRVYFPLVEALAQNQDKEKDKDEDEDVVPQGNETVLLVDDEDIIRRLGVRALSAHGFTVLAAADGQEALDLIERHGRPVDLLITDVVMPGMSGRELARALVSKNMVRRTLFVSGYTDDAIVQHGVLEPGLAFLYKPFTPGKLLRKMREVLDGPADQARA